MKKRTMRNWFIFLFILGLVLGFLIPWDIRDTSTKNNLQSSVLDVAKKFGQLEASAEGIDYSVVSNSDDMSVMLVRLTGNVPMHVHPKENHVIFIYRGNAKLTMSGTTYNLVPGNLVTIPAKVPHSIEKVGNLPAEAIVIAQPPSNPKDLKLVN